MIGASNNKRMFAITFVTAVLLVQVPSPSLCSGVQLETWGNAVMAGVPASTTTTAPLSASWTAAEQVQLSGDTGVLSAVWSGSLTPAVSASYLFNCSFAAGYGIGWVDGHVLCTHGYPLYADNVGPGAIALEGGKPYSIMLRYVKNNTTPAPVASASMLWSQQPTPLLKPLQGLDRHAGEVVPTPIPPSLLTPTLPSAAHSQLAAVQRDQYANTAGWGSWYPHNLLAATRLPDGATIQFGLCQLSTGDCELTNVDSGFPIRLGAHASDGSYAQLFHWYAGVNVSVTWGTVPPTALASLSSSSLHDLRLTVSGVECGNCSNYAIVLVPSFSPVWSGVGDSAVDAKTLSITIAPAGQLSATTFKASGPPLSPTQASLLKLEGVPHLAFAVEPSGTTTTLSSIQGESPAATVAALKKAEVAERATYASYGTPALAELKEAVQASVMWLTVYVPYATGLILTLSRGSMGGGNSQCDWDNFFAALMQGSDKRGRALGFATFAQELGAKTLRGFVPNGSNAAQKARDRTEPIVGAKVLESFLTRFGIAEVGWLIQWSFDQLFGWHDWAWNNRRHLPLGLISAGSSPIAPLVDPSDWAVNTMQGARWETGMDNSPMYDGPDGASDNRSGPVLFNTTSHMMALYDVGMTANLASDMLALVRLGDAWCGAAAGTTAVPHTTPCGQSTKVKIATLRQRAELLATLTRDHLWNEDVGTFTNKLPAAEYNLSSDVFYPRISPTSFYPMMSGVPTPQQADRMVKDHLLNPTGFCITPKDQWPPKGTGAGTAGWDGAVLLQSFKLPQDPKGSDSGARTVICKSGDIDTSRRSAAQEKRAMLPTTADSLGSCSEFIAAGASFIRNESFAFLSQSAATTSSAGSRTPLFQYNLTYGNQIVLGRDGDFPKEAKMSTKPVVWVEDRPPLPGAWPLVLWRSKTKPTTVSRNSTGAAAARLSGRTVQDDSSQPSPSYYWRLTGSPGSEVDVVKHQDKDGPIWTKNATFGYTIPLKTACYWGLPSVSFDDPAFASPGKFVYWRGNAWAPLAMLTYWGLQNPVYSNVSSVTVARQALAHSYATMWMETAWRPSRQVCENYCVHKQGGCCGDTFYHWGALAGFMSILEAGK